MLCISYILLDIPNTLYVCVTALSYAYISLALSSSSMRRSSPDQIHPLSARAKTMMGVRGITDVEMYKNNTHNLGKFLTIHRLGGGRKTLNLMCV